MNLCFPIVSTYDFFVLIVILNTNDLEQSYLTCIVSCTAKLIYTNLILKLSSWLKLIFNSFDYYLLQFVGKTCENVNECNDPTTCATVGMPVPECKDTVGSFTCDCGSGKSQ